MARPRAGGSAWREGSNPVLRLWPYYCFVVTVEAIDDPTRGRARFLVALAGAYAICGGMVTLAGWFFDVAQLVDWDSDGINMKANTAVCVVFAGATLVATALWPAS